jgi:hypothetical protein
MWRIASVLWGVGTLLDAVLRWIMAYTLPIDVVPALTQVLLIGTAVVLFVVTNVYYVLCGAMDGDSRLYDPAGTVRASGASAARRRPRPPSGSPSAAS